VDTGWVNHDGTFVVWDSASDPPDILTFK